MASSRERIMAYARDRQRVTLKELRQLLGSAQHYLCQCGIAVGAQWQDGGAG